MDSKDAVKILSLTRDSYNQIAGEFSSSRNRVWPEMEQLALEYVNAGDKVLDMGCGNGRLLESLPQTIEYLGVDNSEGLIAEAINFSRNRGKFQVGGFDDVGRKFTDYFDAAALFAVLNHLPTVELRLRALKSLYKALKPGGYLLMTNWNMWRLSSKEKSIWKYKISLNKNIGSWRLGFKDVLTNWRIGDRNFPLYYYAFTLKELKELVMTAGFEVVEGYYSTDGKKTNIFQGKNIVVVGKKN